jgi:hypothetical protein
MTVQTQHHAPTAGEQAILDWAMHLPGPDRPVLDLALYGNGKRYGGFTSWLHAHRVARALGFSKYEITPIAQQAHDGTQTHSD